VKAVARVQAEDRAKAEGRVKVAWRL